MLMYLAVLHALEILGGYVNIAKHTSVFAATVFSVIGMSQLFGIPGKIVGNEGGSRKTPACRLKITLSRLS